VVLQLENTLIENTPLKSSLLRAYLEEANNDEDFKGFSPAETSNDGNLFTTMKTKQIG
jgi:hypothetical protein